MNRRQFAKSFAVIAVAEAMAACGSNPVQPTAVPAPNSPQGSSANPVDPNLAGQFVLSFVSGTNGTLYDALSHAGFNPGSMQSSFTNPNGSAGTGVLVRSLVINQKFETPLNGYDFMVNNGHYFADVSKLAVRVGDRIDIYNPPKWNGITP